MAYFAARNGSRFGSRVNLARAVREVNQKDSDQSLLRGGGGGQFSSLSISMTISNRSSAGGHGYPASSISSNPESSRTRIFRI
jgi:hypothetical protein